MPQYFVKPKALDLKAQVNNFRTLENFMLFNRRLKK